MQRIVGAFYPRKSGAHFETRCAGALALISGLNSIAELRWGTTKRYSGAYFKEELTTRICTFFGEPLAIKGFCPSTAIARASCGTPL